MSLFNLSKNINDKLNKSNLENINAGEALNTMMYAEHASSQLTTHGALKIDQGHNLQVVDSNWDYVLASTGSDQIRCDIINTPNVNVTNSFATESTLSTINTSTSDTLTLLDKCSTYGVGAGTHQIRCDIISNVAPTVSKTDVYATGSTIPSSSDVLLTAQSLGNKRCVGIFVELQGDTRSSDIRLQIRAGNDGSGAIQRRYEEITVGRVFDGTSTTLYSYEHPKFPFDNIRVYLINNTLSSQTYEVQIEFSDA